MQTIPKWRNLLIFRESLFHSSHSAAFHSTPVSLGKWKNKWDFQQQQDNERGQQPSKNYIRYATRQKRADAKKALKDLLYKSGSTKLPFQDESTTWNTYAGNSCNAEQENDVHGSSKQFQSKRTAKSASRNSSRAGKNQNFGSKRKLRKESFDDFDVDPETIFEATFGNRCFTWSFRSWKENPSHSSGTFEWRENLNWTKNKKKAWDTSSETDDNEAEPCFVGSSSDRTILGLPPRGPLKMDDVKSAFRLSALKWHPDKHQGPSQVMAEEKFKLCVDAYKSLCSALSSA